MLRGIYLGAGGQFVGDLVPGKRGEGAYPFKTCGGASGGRRKFAGGNQSPSGDPHGGKYLPLGKHALIPGVKSDLLLRVEPLPGQTKH